MTSLPPPDRAACPTCGAWLEGPAPTAFCPGCMWRAFAAEEDVSSDEAQDALFSVPGHDVIAEIARGGGGIVYRARQREPRREVALKMLLPYQVTSEELRARFRIEAETVAMLDHPAILPVYAVSEYRGMPYFTMKLATGGTLAARAKTLRGDWRALAALVATLADAVQFAHAHGVIHRDLKPGNVLFDEQDRAYVSDFGLAKFVNVESSVTRSAMMLGTPAYVAPELVARGLGHATIATDVYALGAILYELLTGRAPFAAASLPLLLQQVLEDSPAAPRRLAPGVPRDLEVICLRALAREPSQRFRSARELAEDLQRWLEGRPIHARPASGAEHFWRWARRHPASVSLGGVLLLVLIGSAGALTRSNRSMRHALGVAQEADATSQELLRAALISEGRLKRRSGTAGQRYAALDSLERAARIAPSLELRNEVAAALARPDLRLRQTFPAGLSSTYSMIDFHPQFTTYLAPAQETVAGETLWRVTLRSLEDGRSLRNYPLRTTGAVFTRFSGDGQRFVSRRWDFTREFWAVDGEEPLFQDGPLGRLEWVGDALHPTRARVALHRATSDIYLRDLDTGEQRLLYRGPDEVMKLAYSPTGDRLAIVSHERVEVIDGETGAVRWAVAGPTNGVDPAWSPDGRRLAWSSTRGELATIVANADDGTEISELRGHRDIQSWFEFSPDANTLYTMARDHTLRWWDIAPGREILAVDMPAYGFAVSPDGTRLAATILPASAALYDIAPSGVFEQLTADHPRPQARSALSLGAHPKNGLVLSATFALDYSSATGGRSGMQVLLWDGEQRREVARFSCGLAADVYENEAGTALFAPGADAILYGTVSAGTRRRTLTSTRDDSFELGDEQLVANAGPGVLLKAIDGVGDWYLHDFHAGSIVVWPEGDAARAYVLAESRDPYLMLEVSPDGNWVAEGTVYRDNIIRVHAAHDPAAGTRQVLAEGSRYFHFSADSRWLLASNRADIRTWHLPDLEPGPTWTTPTDGDVRRSVAFSPDARWVATAGARNVVELRDARTFEPLVRLEAPADFQRCAWSADGAHLYLLDIAREETRLFRWNITVLRSELAARGLDW